MMPQAGGSAVVHGRSRSRPVGHTGGVTAEDWIAVVGGALLVATVLASALRTVVLPQGGLTGITRFVFAVADRVFTSSGSRRPLPRRVAGLYAPAALVSLPFAWCMLLAVGFAFVLWGLGVGSPSDAWVTSGSSLFTLGFAKPDGPGLIWLTFVEATIGLGIVALLISYLPTLYTAYSAREQGVTMLSPITGSPPAAPQLLRRLHAAHALDGLAVWGQTTTWFVAMHQSHTAFPALARFPPQERDHSWVATAGAVLDASAVMLSVAETKDGRPLTGATSSGEEGSELGPMLLTLTQGIAAVVATARAAGLAVERDPPSILDLVAGDSAAVEAISIDRAEYEQALDWLEVGGVIGSVDHDAGWGRFAHVRASYDTALRALAGLTHAPSAPWTTDRPLRVGRPRFFSHRPVAMQEP